VVEGGPEDGGAFVEDGLAVNSANAEVSLDGLPTPEAQRRIIAWLERKGIGRAAVQFKLRDWLFSRQRYWGEPIPIVHYEDGTMEPVGDEELPLLLPDLARFQPSGTTESPLALAADWVNVTDPATGRRGRRETNTMPQWAGSCWYYLRFLDPDNGKALCDPALERYWMPVDLYVGGAEHAVLHLMYARFWHKVLHDLGHVHTPEPFMRLRHQGIILGEDARKMSKSRGNVINPDEIVAEYGADAMRLFEMFMGPLEEMKPWSSRGVEGVFRFLNRVWRLFVSEDGTLEPMLRDGPVPPELERVYHATVRKVGEDIEALRFNTAISQMMIFVNEVMKSEVRPRAILEPFVLVLSPFAPHLAEELWQKLGHPASLAHEPWPAYDPAKLVETTVDIVLQVNGKVRGKIAVAADTPEKDLEALALADESVRRHCEGKRLVKAIVVRNRLVNLVVQ
jgi:leucyl-tRNA synthetase